MNQQSQNQENSSHDEDTDVRFVDAVEVRLHDRSGQNSTQEVADYHPSIDSDTSYIRMRVRHIDGELSACTGHMSCIQVARRVRSCGIQKSRMKT